MEKDRRPAGPEASAVENTILTTRAASRDSVFAPIHVVGRDTEFPDIFQVAKSWWPHFKFKTCGN